jgi:hypothetical protein
MAQGRSVIFPQPRHVTRRMRIALLLGLANCPGAPILRKVGHGGNHRTGLTVGKVGHVGGIKRKGPGLFAPNPRLPKGDWPAPSRLAGIVLTAECGTKTRSAEATKSSASERKSPRYLRNDRGL